MFIIDLGKESAVDSLEYLQKCDYSFSNSLSSSIVYIKGDASLIFLIFINLSANSFPYTSHHALMAFLFSEKRTMLTLN